MQQLESERQLVSALRSSSSLQAAAETKKTCVICFDDAHLGIECNGSTPVCIDGQCMQPFRISQLPLRLRISQIIGRRRGLSQVLTAGECCLSYYVAGAR
jgi:hypothetical protein